jgi:hypothetical protein
MEYDQTCFALLQDLPQGLVTQFGKSGNCETVMVLDMRYVNKEKLYIEIIQQNSMSCDIVGLIL